MPRFLCPSALWKRLKCVTFVKPAFCCRLLNLPHVSLLWPWKAFLLSLFFLRLESLIELALIRSISIRYRRASASQVMSLVLDRLLLLQWLLGSTILGALHVLNLLSDFAIDLHISQLLLWDSKAVDTEVSTDAINDQECPAEVDNNCEDEVHPQVPQLRTSSQWRKAKNWKVESNGAADQWPEHDGPVWEWLLGEVGEDDFGGHAAEDERHGEAEEYQVVLVSECRMWAEKPCADGESKNSHRRPLQEHRRNWQTISAAGCNDVAHAERNVRSKEGDHDNSNPNISERNLAP